MDATYWGNDFGVLLIVDAYRKRLLWRKFLNKKETIADYLGGGSNGCVNISSIY